MKIKSISILGMHNIVGITKTYKFKDINYIIGNNGAGKSTILQAIQLALLGYIPGTDKRVSEIFTHCASKAMTVDLRLTDDDHVTDKSPEKVRILRTWSFKGTKIQSNVTIEPEGFDVDSLVSEIELPIFNFNEFLSLSRNKLKSWFLDFLPEPDCKIDWRQEFETALLTAGHILADPSYLDEVLKEGTVGDSGLSSVQATNVGLHDLLADKKLEVARLEGAVQALIFYDDLEADDYEASREEILRSISDIKKLRDNVAGIKRTSEFNTQIADKIGVAKTDCVDSAQLAKDKEFIAEYEEQIKDQLIQEEDEAVKEVQDLRYKIGTLQMDIDDRQKIISGKGICPYTQQECDTVSNLIETLKTEIENLKAELADVEEQEAQADANVRAIRKKQFETDAKYGVATQNVDCAAIADLKIAALKKQLIPLSDKELSLLQTDIAQLDEKEQQLQDELAKLEANRSYEEKINEITANKFKAENEMEALKILIKRTDANNMQTEIAQLPFAEFADSMNAVVLELFGEGTRFKINLEARANSFSFGIAKDSAIGEIYVPYDLMSSGEKTLLAFAMMVYIVKQSSSALKLVMIDDMLDHLDDTNIISMFEKFADTDVQIINAGVKRVSDDNVNVIEI